MKPDATRPRRDQLLEMIQELALIQGPSGSEEAVRDRLKEWVTPYAQAVSIDPLGNLLVRAKGSEPGDSSGSPSEGEPEGKPAGNRRRIMLIAHMDEIGVIATHIDENGFIRIRPIGGVSPTMLLGQRVRFVNGTVGAVGIEKIDGPKDITFEKLYVDIGAESREEAASMVQIGDAAVLWRPVEQAGPHRLLGKALDNRTGCAVAVQTLIELAQQPSPHTVDVVFSVQEEVGLRGAGPAAYGLNPDLALAIDVTATGDTPKAPTMDVALGKGVAIKVMDRSLLTHPRIKELLVETAKAESIPYQMEILTYGGTDAGAVHLTRGGIPSGVVSLPTRYLHTPTEMVDLRDLDAAVSLLVAFLRRDTIQL